MRISFDISAELAKTLQEECELTHMVLDNARTQLTPAEFAKECLESELASRRIEMIQPGLLGAYTRRKKSAESA